MCMGMGDRIRMGLWTVHFGRLRRLKLLNILLLFRGKREERRFLPLQPPSCLQRHHQHPCTHRTERDTYGHKSVLPVPEVHEEYAIYRDGCTPRARQLSVLEQNTRDKTYRGRLSIAPTTRCNARVRHRVDCAVYRQLAPGVHPRRPRIRPPWSFRSHSRLPVLRR